MCESDMVTLRRAEAQVQYRNCAESALTIHVYFTHCASARGRALRKNKVRLGIHLRREWDCTYLPPDNSTYSNRLHTDCCDILENDVKKYLPLGEVILLGDMNARTACGDDHLRNDTDLFIPDPIPYIMDEDLPSRNNQDLTTNERGKSILDMCISSGLRILNGRKPGDSLGYFTCHKYNGSSTVDYGIVSERLFKDIMYFHVHSDLGDISDHCQISLCIQNVNFLRKPKNKLLKTKLPQGYIWDENSEFYFGNALEALTPMMNDFNKTQFGNNPVEVNNALQNLNSIILTAANNSLKKTRKRPTNKKTVKKQKWYGPNLQKMKLEIKKIG